MKKIVFVFFEILLLTSSAFARGLVFNNEKIVLIIPDNFVYARYDAYDSGKDYGFLFSKNSLKYMFDTGANLVAQNRANGMFIMVNAIVGHPEFINVWDSSRYSATNDEIHNTMVEFFERLYPKPTYSYTITGVAYRRIGSCAYEFGKANVYSYATGNFLCNTYIYWTIKNGVAYSFVCRGLEGTGMDKVMTDVLGNSIFG